MSSIEPDESQDYRGNSVLLSEGVSASDPCLSLRPPLLPSARPGHKPRLCPPPPALLSLPMSVSQSLNLPSVSSNPPLGPLSLSPMIHHGLQRHIDTHRTDLALIKRIHQHNLSITIRDAWITTHTPMVTYIHINEEGQSEKKSRYSKNNRKTSCKL